MMEANYSPSCQYLQGPATLDFLFLIQMLEWIILANTVTT